MELEEIGLALYYVELTAGLSIFSPFVRLP